MMTEAEAKTKWCPHSHIPPNHRDGFCIGSACMAWRWHEKVAYPRFIKATLGGEPYHPKGGREPTRPENVPASYVWEPWTEEDEPDSHSGWREPQAEADARRRGFCGAFGRPE